MAVIGSVVGGKYEILTMVGEGGMSKVYLAMDRNLNRQLAVKEVQKSGRDRNNEIIVQSAIAEANILKNLSHAGLAFIVDIIETVHEIYVVMEYVEGQSLDMVLEEFGAQPQELVVEWAKQLCVVLDYLHTRKPAIIYRDMKPHNVRLKPDGNLKLIDFGIAREHKEQNLADTISLGTKGYAAPEQFGGKGQTDARTDIYCLGATLYHLITGQNPAEPPYEIMPIRHWNPSLSGGLEYIITKCTQLNPRERYQSCDELLYDLDNYDKLDLDWRKSQKKKLKVFNLFLAAALLSLLVGIVGMSMRTATDNADFANLMLQAKQAATAEDKAAYYLAAIEIKPLETAAYLGEPKEEGSQDREGGLIAAFKEDNIFTIEEEVLLRKSIDSHLAELGTSPDYAEISFEIGKLYWFYYDYGQSDSTDDNQVTRMKSAVPWFKDAADAADGSNVQMATVYSEIGTFHQDIVLRVTEGDDRGRYLPYFAKMEELLDLIDSDPDDNEMVSLELYRLIRNSIETYARKFRTDLVSQERMAAIMERVAAGVDNVDATQDATEELQQQILSRIPQAEAAIENAYRE